MTTEQPHDFQDDSQAVGPGQLLRNAREQLGWTREQVASRIHLRLTLIAAIESDTYDKHTSHTFIRGYLRTYAKLVGIPEETILAAYDKLGLTPPDNIDMQSFSRRSRQQANDSRLKVVTWLVILVLIALSVAWWWQSTARRSAGDEALAATEMGATSNTPSATVPPAVDVADPVVAPATSAAAAISVDPVASSAATTLPVDASSAVATTAVATSAATATQPAADTAASEPAKVPQLKMSFTADCWLDVKDAKGKTLFSGLKKANDELVLEGPEPLKFIIGAPMAVNIEYQGKSIDMSRYNNGRTARLSLPQE
ncbi:helix-turn-helix domain-containing protein [Aeromonas hydrophila]|uniref:RodZ domain-containing protein n=1 Tax=Aeromonas hydrophila TaxID=644 RepID=UPI0011160DE7|nr:RodZ domain-containing protein [Aeromonas hydrophila]TNH73948.1 helix-turn-helix domain-containing protein [Aeromonas hydrophila]TNH91359.1 helix-turn-helix domain-containing protein [Aeromonas hydrophila]TNH99728.1 helix-turn-helix domain-containing protein [Aeromonas hydrophila]TNI92334.1 helix-turn-helix domain-containing protein [Aeromonas hydrophila]GKQ97086.1 XRE family transcriptional regulator [Aeromonas hydrophila]